MDADSYRRSTMTPEEAAEHDRVFGDLAGRTRALMEAQLLTEVDHDEVEAVGAEIDALTERLRAAARADPHGVEVGPGGRVRNYGNAVVGLRNPIAVPLDIRKDDDGHARASFTLGAVYEGPPGCVHGGVLALLLDQVLGECAAASGSPGMTGTLTLRYLRPTPLGDCSIDAWVDRVEGVKTFVHGEFRRADGKPTVDVEGIFILPKWAREALAEEGRKPPRFE
jgi:acyl-coenzyme A thioesterase PaaI-like protein